MSIWVRSQDKKMLVKINNVFLEKKETMIRNLLTEENLEENNEIYLDFDIVENINIREITDSVINNLKDGKIHAYDKLNRL